MALYESHYVSRFLLDGYSSSEAAPLSEVRLLAERLAGLIAELPIENRIEALNKTREVLHVVSPFVDEPVDFVRWVKSDQVQANDYNPNTVAPPEMELLRLSVTADGFTQPIVSWPVEDGYEVVDGFHRTRVGKEQLADRLFGYLPITEINTDREDRGDRIAATIRHNRARGKHRVDAMSDIVVELKRRNWSDAKIGKNLGMDPDEVLRLSQISGLAEMFADREFSEAWEADLASTIDETDTLEDAE
jgi:ParB-like chromosome segregation protein Spo0J